MKKIILTIFMLLLFTYPALASIAAYDAGSGVIAVAIHEDETVYDARVSAYIYDIDAYGKTSINKISSGKTTLLYLQMAIPEEAYGYYPMKITLSGEDIKLKTYVWVWLN